MARGPTSAEKARMAAGPRYDPGKPKAPWGKRAGDRTITSGGGKRSAPVIEEAPPVTAPMPPPPPPPKPPTLEPVIPQPYVPPKDGVAVEWHSLKGAKLPDGRPDPYAMDKTKPTVLVTPDGVRHYTPWHHAMWESLGMRTSEDYADYLRTGEASQYVGVREGLDKPMLVSRRELAKASALTGEEQFKALVEVGVIPRGSKFMPGPGGYKSKGWSYIDPETKQKMKGALLARLARASVKKPRVVIPPGMKVDTRPAYRELRPAQIASPAIRELAEDPEGVLGRLSGVTDELKGLPHLTFIQKIIKDWQEAREHFGGEILEIKQGKLQARLKTILDEITGVEQKEYFDRMGEYNSQVIEFNRQVDWLNGMVGGLEKEGKELPIDEVKEYNATMAKLNAQTLSLEREAPGVNLESLSAVNRFNEKVNTLARAFAVLQGKQEKINTFVQEVDIFNAKVEKLNLEAAGLKEPGEIPEEPTKTMGTVARAIFEGIKAEYKHAAREELTLKEKVSNVSLLTAELIVPGVWVAAPYTKTDIRDRKPSEILLNIGLDLLIVIPMLRLATLGIKRVLAAGAKGMVREAVKAEAKIAKDAVKAMRVSYGKDAATALEKVSQIQATYLKRLARLERMKAKGLTTTSQLRATLKTENQLTAAARSFINEVQRAQSRLGRKGVVGAGFDSPTIARAFNRMPEELVRHTKGVLRAITKPKGKQSLKQLEADVAKAEATLNAAKAKYPFDTSKWADLVGELLEKQAILSQSKAGGLAKIQSEFTRVGAELNRVRAKILEKTLNPARVGRKPKVIQRRILATYQKQRRILKQAELSLERQRLALARQLKAGMRKMEIEWGRGGAVGRGGGGIATAVRPRGAPARLSGGTATTVSSTATMTTAQAAARTALGAAIVDVIGRPIPGVEEITKGLTDVEVIKQVEIETLKAIRLAEKLATKPATKLGVEAQTKLAVAAQAKLAVEIAQRVRAALEASIKAALSPKVAAALETKIALITDIATKVGLEVAEPLKPLEPIKPILIPGPTPKPTAGDKGKRKFVDDKPGIVAYRRGALKGKSRWLVFYHPYGEDDRLELYGAAPAGAITFTGKGSAKKTATVLRGEPPKKPIRVDTGAVDDIIRSTDGRITIEHVKDKNVGGKEVYRTGGVSLAVKESTKRGRTRVKELKDVIVRDAGAGVEETRRGRTHIPLEGSG